MAAANCQGEEGIEQGLRSERENEREREMGSALAWTQTGWASPIVGPVGPSGPRPI